VGVFKSDLLTASEMSFTIKAGKIMHANLLQADVSWFTATRVMRILGDINNCVQIRGKDKGVSMSLWAIRNADKYTGMSLPDVLNEYNNQIAQCRQAGLQLIKNNA
jgi:hypothetical protein